MSAAAGRGGGGVVVIYFAGDGPRKGPIRDRDRIDALGVLESPDIRMPIGMALATGWDAEGVSRYRLIVHGVELAGRWSVVDRIFVPAKGPGPGSSR